MSLHNLARVFVGGAPGTATNITLAAAVPSFLTFALAGVSDGETVTYAIEDGSYLGSVWIPSSREIGRGTYTAAGTLFARTTVLASTSGGSRIPCSNNAQIFITAAAEDIAPLPDMVGTNGQLIVGQTGAQALWKTITGDWSLTAAGVATLLNIGNDVTMAADILATNIVAPGTPAAGKTRLYVDSTQKVLSAINDAGTVSNTVVPSTAPTHQFATAVSAAGVVSYAQPQASDINTGFTLGSVVFAGASGALSQDNANFFWNSTTHLLGIGTNSLVTKVTIADSAVEANLGAWGSLTVNADAADTTTANWQFAAIFGNPNATNYSGTDFRATVRAGVAGVGLFDHTGNNAYLMPGIYGWVPTGGHGSGALAGMFDRPDGNNQNSSHPWSVLVAGGFAKSQNVQAIGIYDWTAAAYTYTLDPKGNESANTLTLASPLTVANGGTGLATLTAHAVLLGEGTSNVAFATIGTAGRLLIDQGASADPSFNAMSGDATMAASGALTLATVNSNIGSFGAATSIPVITVNGKGLITAVTTATPTVTAVNGVSYPASYTSGGIPYASSSSAISSSGALTLNGVVYGGGAGAAPLSTAQGGANTVLVANAGAPSFSTTLPSGLSATNLALTNPMIGGVAIRIPLAGNITLYVNPSSTTSANCNGQTCSAGSDSNSCLTIASPCLTQAHAVNILQAHYDLQLQQATIQLSDNNVTGATYDCLQITATMVGGITGGGATSNQLIIQGNTSTPTNVKLLGCSGNAIYTLVGSAFPISINSMQLGASTSGAAVTGGGIVADFGSKVYYSNITWGFLPTNSNHITAEYGSTVEQEGPETIIGGAGAHWAVLTGEIILKGHVVTCTGTPAFATAFVSLSLLSKFTLNSASFSGCSGVTGSQYTSDTTSAFGGGITDPNLTFPGSNPGITAGTIYGQQTVSDNGIGNSVVPGYIQLNSTAATAGTQQASPCSVWSGQGWKTNATAASQEVDFALCNVPVSGSANPSANLNMYFQVAGGGYTNIFNFFSNGIFNAGSGFQLGGVAASGNYLRGNGTVFGSAALAASDLTGQVAVANGGTACSSASITCFNNITGYTASGATGTTSTNLVFSTSPSITTPTLVTSATIGQSTTINSGVALQASRNTGTLPAGPTGTTVQLANADASATVLHLISAGSGSVGSRVIYWNSGGTIASPTATQSGDGLLANFGTGYGTSFNQSAGGGFYLTASQTWTAANNGAQLDIFTTPNNTAVVAVSTRFFPSGGVGIGETATDPGIGSLQVNAQMFAPNITQTSAMVTGTLCWTTGTGKFTIDTTTTCLLSSEQYKHDFRPLDESLDALTLVLAARPGSFFYNEDIGIAGEQIGFKAEEMATLDDRLVSFNLDGRPRAVRYQQYTAVLTRALQQLKADNDDLRAELKTLQTKAA